MIEKTALDTTRFCRQFGYFPRARDAFGAVLDENRIGRGESVLLPAYIGWSPREGSGVFDPIETRGITPVFYRMDGALHIDEESFLAAMRASPVKAVLFIHYFGFVDPAFFRLAAIARENGLLVIEDAAHALYTDMVGGACGRTGDYTLYSLHKMLPFSGGGMLAANFGRPMPASAQAACPFGNPFSYDFPEIARTLTGNYEALRAALSPLAERITPLWPELPAGVVPQTFPVLVRDYDRFLLYRQLNELGYGAVALYHTMIPPLSADAFPESAFLAAHIMNFPVHQDVDAGEYPKLAEAIGRLLRGGR